MKTTSKQPLQNELIYWRRTAASPRPAVMRWIAIAIAVMVGRASALYFMQNLGEVGTPISWLIPWGVDAFLGLSALIVLYLFRQYRGVYVWGAVLAWHVVGAVDLVGGAFMAQVDPFVSPIALPADPEVIVMTLLAIQLAAITLLLKRNVISFMVSSNMP
ncbi:hypothetical protein PsAD2_03511 [Pseudovibrio axinellae]|uniref:Uncharacterized protein n=1 Tax=Pseudovibrio axinellae TaxID=989403 RepID=A0A165W250_9HYPH|nr:hypothetical protein [Pseudovibrio axinellae]KZL15851.1 hypothetical protein PsAD2_03511 [Pseudovibrio axinellae]SER87092.1 hypothetical protein SAMN05421798_1437 [Pseudovibrio axinellae]